MRHTGPDNLSANCPAPTAAYGTTMVPAGLDTELLAWILGVGSTLIVGTNLLVGVALLLLIRKKGSQSWCLVLNLALADTLVGLAITGLATNVVNAHASPTHRTRCLVCMALVTSPSAASILTMFLISLDRYLAIKLPLRYPQITGARTTAAALVVLWLVSFTVGFLPGMVRQMQQSHYNGFCTFFSVIQPKTIILVFCVCFFPLLSVFLYFYLDILKIACSHQRQIHQTGLAGSRALWRHAKALRTVALLVGCFTLSWCPFFVVSIVQVFCQGCSLYHVIENDLWLLGLSNSLINPLVYACWQREVRQELYFIFACIKGKLAHVAPLLTIGLRHDEQTLSTETTDQSVSHNPTLSQPMGPDLQTSSRVTASTCL